MSFGDLIHQLGNEHKTVIRHIEQTTKKLIKAKYALAFNKTCINENIVNHCHYLQHSPISVI